MTEERASGNGRALTLIGDGIENPANARNLMDAASMFEAGCRFLDDGSLREAWIQSGESGAALPLVGLEQIAEGYRPRIAFDNLPGAADLHGFVLPPGPRPAVLVGNERRGLTRAVAKLADRSVQLPMVSRKINCLNVSAAAAVALYYLSRGGGARMQARTHPEKRRPEILLLGAADHFELGSTIRSACALGWSRVFVDDRARIWFGCDRVTTSEGRAAARRGRNSIHVVPTSSDRGYLFEEVLVVTRTARGFPLPRADLAGGPTRVIAIPDEEAVDVEAEDWARLGRDVTFVRLEVPSERYAYRYRFPATIALAEAARQIGRRAPGAPGRPPRREPPWESALRVLLETESQRVWLEGLSEY